jgi:hypothetical protein
MMQEPIVVTASAFQRRVGEMFRQVAISGAPAMIITSQERPVLAIIPIAIYEAFRRAERERYTDTARLWEVTL